MKIAISETGKIKKINLRDIVRDKDITKKFIRRAHGLGLTYPIVDGEIDRTARRTISKAKFKELAAVIAGAQDNEYLKSQYLSVKGNYIHEVIRAEIKKARLACDCVYRDPIFEAANSVAIERNMWERLCYGIPKYKGHKDLKGESFGSFNEEEQVTFTHFRHEVNDDGESWLMQVHGNFVMEMPRKEDCIAFRDGVQFEFKAEKGSAAIEHIDNEEWFRPISLSSTQEGYVREVICAAVEARFKKEGEARLISWAY